MKQWSYSSYRSIAINHYLSYHMPFEPSRFGLHFDVMGLAASDDSSRTFPITKHILKSSQNCDSCSSPMVLTSCAATKSADLFIWRCRPLLHYLYPNVRDVGVIITLISVLMRPDLSQLRVSVRVWVKPCHVIRPQSQLTVSVNSLS
jgi:hypothetical protein